jgi:hypothetical protein
LAAKGKPARKRYDSDTEARKTLAKALTTLPMKYLECRDPGIRHPWSIVNDMHVAEVWQERGRKIMHVARDSICSRCGTLKTEMFIVGNNGLEKIGNYYTYPEDYKIPGVPRGVKPSTVLWQEQYRRAMEKAAHAAKGERETSER